MIPKHLFAVGVMCYTLLFHAHAQPLPPLHKILPEKASLFSRLPDKMNVSELWLHKLFDGADSGSVKIPLTANTFFEGFIKEKVRVNANVININIISSNYDGAMLSVSKITYDDLSVKFIGRIISPHYNDVFLLTEEDNLIYFRKKKQSVVITE